jgi:hypothetical protein
MPSESTLIPRLDAVTRAGAIGLLLTYAAGFLIISLHQSSLG